MAYEIQIQIGKRRIIFQQYALPDAARKALVKVRASLRGAADASANLYDTSNWPRSKRSSWDVE